MASEDSRQPHISIRCPSCGSRFDVIGKMPGQMVVCGECDARFEIRDSVIMRGKRFYPGEKRDPLLDQVSKVRQPLPNATHKGVSDSFASQSKPIQLQPYSPLRILLVILAIFVLAVTALLLVLGASRGGALDGVPMEKRILAASFAAVISTGLLVFSNPRTWMLMLLTGIVLGGCLISIPLVCRGGTEGFGGPVEKPSDDKEADLDSAKVTFTIDEMRELIGITPLEKEQYRLLISGSTRTALGLWFRHLEEHNRLLINDYVIREMGASSESHFYPRGKGDYLMVVTGVDHDLQKLAAVASALGTIKAIHEPLHTVEVEVDNSNFKSGPIGNLTNPNDPEFYRLNRIELNSIDLERVSAAIRRLSEAEPLLLRDDIHKRLVNLLSSKWYENKAEVCRALLVWATEDDKDGMIALQQAVILREKKQDIPPEMIALCIKQKEMGVLPLLYELWKTNPLKWEPWFREAGEESEKIILLGFDDITGVLLQSACRILGQVGGQRSLPILRVTASSAADAETRIVADTSMQLIEKRIAANTETN